MIGSTTAHPIDALPHRIEFQTLRAVPRELRCDDDPLLRWRGRGSWWRWEGRFHSWVAHHQPVLTYRLTGQERGCPRLVFARPRIRCQQDELQDLLSDRSHVRPLHLRGVSPDPHLAAFDLDELHRDPSAFDRSGEIENLADVRREVLVC